MESPPEEEEQDVFEIPSKEPEPEALRKWRQATLVLNAARRFRYTAKLEAAPDGKVEVLSHSIATTGRFKKAAQAMVAVQRFQSAGRERAKRQELKEELTEGVPLSVDQLSQMNSEASVDHLRQLGGVKAVCRALRVDPSVGIFSGEDEKRREEYGPNTYPEKPQKTFLEFVWDSSQDSTLIILMICAIVSLISGMVTESPSEGWHDGSAIAFAVILVILVTAISDYRQSLQFRGLDAEKANIQLKVLRDGRRQTVSIFDIVVGDIVPLSIGDQVPGDGLVLESHSLTIDESSMTGESIPLRKDADKPFLLSGCKVVDGYGVMLVTGVGTNTEWGRIFATLSEDDDSETPLQVRLNGLATAIGKVGLVFALAVLLVLVIRYVTSRDYEGKGGLKVVKDIVDIFSIAVTIVVVAVPEGLPLAVTLTLAYSMRKMMNDKALVRNLAACETMGCATTICSDKTGTLTLNQMSVVDAYVAGDRLSEPCVKSKDISAGLWELLYEGIALNSTGSVFIPPEGEPEVTASPTESAIITWGLKLRLDFDRTKAAFDMLAVEVFNSTKKKAGVAVRANGSDADVVHDQSAHAAGCHVHWKGAAEIIVENCAFWMDKNGEKREMTREKREEVLSVIQSMAENSLRCIAFGFKRLGSEEMPKGGTERDGERPNLDDWKFPEDELSLLGLVGIKDPCRPGVPQAVATCQRAGIKVRMVTGDNILTARAIANECGILTPHGIVIEGKDFRVMGEDEMKRTIPKIDVMARSSPTDKHLLVKMLRSMGEVVAVTGDGTNDAPALHEADIGLSMGIAGTEVAKESSDIVILDDNFTSIVKVCRWGRSVYANIQKFIQFQLTVNAVALIVNFVAACSDGHVPLTAVQLLWVNLIMDTLGALALATEQPTDELLLKEPVGRKSPLITNVMWRNIFGQAVYQLVVLLAVNYDGFFLLNLGTPSDNTRKIKNTMIFNAFVFCQLFNEINCRKPESLNVFEGFFTNPLFQFVLFTSTAFQIVIVEFLHQFASTVSLTGDQWATCIVIGFLSMPLAVVVKLIPVPETPFTQTLFPRRLRRKLGRNSSTRNEAAAGVEGGGEDSISKASLVKSGSKNSSDIGNGK